MASFADSSNLQYLTSYNPYIQQNPIEAEYNVGVQKQAQYQQGVEKIQENIDKVAGLDVVRDVDKQYLQSKLNTLQGDLRKVASGDFSNFQLVNSVGGMINSIAKDSNVQNAVGSTIRYRKGVQDMELARKEGKSSPSNEWDFSMQANQWLGNNDIKSSFSGQYNPYTNYKKNALEVIKSLAKDETITDDAFTVDNRGNIVIADAIVRKKLAGISPEKIQTALMATLTPGDFKQMEIDGRYNYSNVNPQKFVQDIHSSFSNQLDFYRNQKKVLENAKSSTTSVPEKNRLDEQIASIDKTIRGIATQHEDINSMIIGGNLEGAKAHLQTTDFINNFSKAFSYTETSQTYQNSPFSEAARWREGQERDWNKFIMTYNQKEREIDLKKDEVSLKKKEAAGYGGLPFSVDQNNLPTLKLNDIVKNTETQTENLKQLDNAFLMSQGRDGGWFNQQKEAYDKGLQIEAATKEYFNLTEKHRREVEGDQAMLLGINKRAAKELGIDNLDDYVSSLIPRDAAPVVYSGFEYSPTDFVEFNQFIKDKGIKSFPGASGAATITAKKEEEITKNMSPKELTLYQIFKKNNRGYVTPDEREVINNFEFYDKNVNRPYSATLDKIEELTQEELKNRVLSPQGGLYNIPTSSTEQKRTIGGVLSQFADLAESQNGKLPLSGNFDVDTARKLSNDDKSYYKINVVEGTKYQPEMYEVYVSNDKESVNFRISPEEKQSIFGNEFEASPQVRAIRPYQEQIKKMGGYSTALTDGPSNHNNAYLSNIDFTNPTLKSYGVKANLVTPIPNLYQLRLSIFDPIKQTWVEDIPYPQNSLISQDAIQSALSGLGDAEIFEMLNGQPLTSQDLQKLKEASKKPL